jgi:uncharacterized protein
MTSHHSESALGNLESELRRLPHSQQLAFAAACCERAYPNYLRFFQLTGWGEPAALRASLDMSWDFIENPTPVLNEIRELEQKCLIITPDLDDFSSPEVDVEAAAAQEAAFMVRLLLQFCGDPQVSYALRIATLARDTLDLYIQTIDSIDPADPDLDNKIAHHPLMLQEMCKQESDAEKLTGIKTRHDLREFRRNATNLEKSNIGLTVTGRFPDS